MNLFCPESLQEKQTLLDLGGASGSSKAANPAGKGPVRKGPAAPVAGPSKAHRSRAKPAIPKSWQDYLWNNFEPTVLVVCGGVVVMAVASVVVLGVRVRLQNSQ